MLARLSARLRRVAVCSGSRGGLAVAVCIAALPALTTLEGGLVADDHLQYAMVRHRTRAAWDLFSFLSGNPAETREKIARGELPWILSPDVKHVFFRPLASVTHWLDYRLWGAVPALAHLQSVLWLGVLAAAVAFAYRRIEGARWTVPLAALVYLWSPAVAFSVAWLAGRNTLMATAFGTAALGAHHSFRTSGSRRWQGAAVLLLLLSLASGEAAVGGVALLLAYAAFFEAGPRAARAVSVAPYAVLAGAWWATELGLGFGATGSAVYADFQEGPWRVLRTAASHVPELALFALGRAHLLALHGFRPSPVAPLLVAGAALLTLLVAARALTDRVTRFWALGAVLAALPFSLMIPQVRLLASANVAWTMAVVRTLDAALESAPGGVVRRTWRRLQIPALAAALAFALLLGLACSVVPSHLAKAALRVLPGLPDAERAASRALDRYPDSDIVVPIGDWLLPHTARLIQEERGVRPVRSIATLASATDVRVDRPAENMLLVHAPRGMLGDAGHLLRSAPFRVGERVRAPRFTVEVLETTPDLGPTELRYTFDCPLDDPQLDWLTDSGPLGLLPVAPPPVGYRAAPGVPR